MANFNNWRYERKFLIPLSRSYQIERILKTSESLFYESFPNREVRSIYYDTPDLLTCVQNIEGLSDRTKYRVRWYGGTFQKVPNALFEYKIKKNKTNSKKFFALQPFQLNETDNINSILKKIKLDKKIRGNSNIIDFLRPTVFTEYTREYYESACGCLRATIDKNILFRKASNLRFKYQFRNYQILELKYLKDNPKFQKLINQIPLRSTRMSKYINALYSLSII